MKKKVSGLLVCIVCLSFAGVAFALTAQEKLGKLIYEDPAFSVNGNQSCQSCHHPNAQFSDPVNRISPMYRPVSEGSHAGLFGGRNAPPAAYAAYSPSLYYDDIEGLFIGGLFWDGRATGRMDISGTGDLGAGPTGDPLADQAKGPFGNPVEMALERVSGGLSTEDKVVGILRAKYAKDYKKAYKTDIANEDVKVAYNNIALAISAFEKTGELNKFSSKFDRFRKEQGGDVSMITVENARYFASKVYTREEIEGLALFNTEADHKPEESGGGGSCFLCHPTANLDDGGPSLFTDFSYDNLGIPVNKNVAALAGDQPIDYGLGSQVDILETISPANVKRVARRKFRGDADTKVEVALDEMGKFKVSSLRNIAKTAPYGHNGFFPTLYDIVHFYNTRDVDTGWPRPEVARNVNGNELGNLGLSFAEEQKIVVFLETLTDE